MAKNWIPVSLWNHLHTLYSPGMAEKIIRIWEKKRSTTFRVNLLKADIDSVGAQLRQRSLKCQPADWLHEAFILQNGTEGDLEKLDCYKQGQIYVQSLSSMIPPLVLAPQPGESVLDIAAAPGSKTTQIGVMMNNQGTILANEIHPLRLEKLKYNLQMQGVMIAEVRLGAGEQLGRLFPQKFDAVLLDAPCSGEGRIQKNDASSWRGWSPQLVQQSVKTQKKLLISAYAALRPGGRMVYSTCTLNREENEGVLDEFVRSHPCDVLPIPLALQPRYRPLLDGVSSKLQHALRILPSETMEGFFVCLLQKTE